MLPGNHQHQIITNLLYMITNIIKYFITRTWTGPVAVDLIICQCPDNWTGIIQSTAWGCVVSVIPFCQILSRNFRIGSSALINAKQGVYLTIQKSKIFTEFLSCHHIIFFKHIDFRSTWIFCNRQNPCHICKFHISLSFQQVSEEFKIILLVLLRDKILVKNSIPFIHHKDKSDMLLLEYSLQIIPDTSICPQFTLRVGFQ